MPSRTRNSVFAWVAKLAAILIGLAMVVQVLRILWEGGGLAQIEQALQPLLGRGPGHANREQEEEEEAAEEPDLDEREHHPHRAY